MPRNGKLVRISLVAAVAALVAIAAVTTAGVASARSSGGTVNGAGSTFVAPLVSKWTAPVHQDLGLTLNYSAVGSTAGVQDISTKQVNFGASDAPLSQFPQFKCACVQIPWALAATGVVYNLGGSLQHLNMTGSVLAQIYLGKITKWNAGPIKKINKGRALPNEKITVVYRQDGSGTTYNFTDYLSHVSHAWKSGPGTGTSVTFPVGVSGSHSSGLAALVRSNPGAIGYVDVDYAIVNHFGLMKLKNRSGKFVLPRAVGIKAAAALDTHPAKDGSLSIVNPPKSKKFRNAYPICTYTYVDVQKSSGSNAGALKKLIGWVITKGQSYGPPIVFEPLPKAVVTFDKTQLKKIHS
jgi:phosphate transport system substrate-binding protein